MKIGSLCTGYGGLDMAVEAFFDAETVWCSEFDKYASQIVDARIKKPNLGDLTKIDWTQVEPIDILTAGYPCQPFSHAGQRKGTNDTRHIFPYIAQAIEVLRPKYIVLENVRGHLTLGFEEVLGTLTKLGYDTRWQVVRASDVGAPHQRARLFIIAYSNSEFGRVSLQNETFTYTNSEGLQRSWNTSNNITDGITSNTNCNSCEKSRRTFRGVSSTSGEVIDGTDWKKCWRCDQITEREVPPTLDQDKRLNAQFVEYMMGLPKGWVTDVGLSRSQQLKILGNGVVPQQAYFALNQLCVM